MRKLYLFIYLFSCLPIFPNNPPPNNAIALSLGGASAAHHSPFSIEYNSANLVWSPSQFGFNAQNRFGIGDYSSLFVVNSFKLDKAALGLSFLMDQGELITYKTQVAFAKKIEENISVGIALNHLLFKSINPYYKKKHTVTFNLGVSYIANPKMEVGFQISNPTHSQLIQYPNESIPTNTRLGICYSITPNIKAYLDGIQSTNEPLNGCIGLEIYREEYTVRGGFNFNQVVGLGLTFKKKSIHFDIGLSIHNVLGLSPAINGRHAW